MNFSKYLVILFISIFATKGALSQDIANFETNIRKAELAKDTLALARSYYKLGVFYDKQQKTQKSNTSFLQALNWANSIKSYNAIATIANYLASNYSISGQPDSSIHFYNIALKAGIEYGDSTKLPVILMNLGDEYAGVGEYVKAANYAISAIRIKEQIKDSTNLANFYQNVGEIYKVAGENNKWEEYVKKAYELIRIEKYTSIQANAAIYNDLGGIAEKHENYKQALLYYDTLTSIGEKNNYPHAIGIALSNSATIYKAQGDINKALQTALQARDYKTGKGYQNIYDYNLLAELFLEQNNSNEAIKYALLAANNPSINDNPGEKMRAFKNLYQIEKSRGNFETALRWNENYKHLSDSIRDKEIRTQIVDLEIAYQTEKKVQQIQLLTTENKLKNQELKAGIAIVVILLIIIILILYILQIRKKQAAFKQNDLQQQVLRAQMNPHFIFNVLGSIQNFMMQNNTRKASSFLSQFASLTRATLNNSAAETISLADEIAMLKNYIELEKMRSKDKFNFEINYDEDLEIDFIQIPPMLIQPFVENSIKHGFKSIENKGLLCLNFYDEGEKLKIEIIDNGIGIKKAAQLKPSEHGSKAMKIFEERRKLFAKKTKQYIDYTVTDRSVLDSGKQGTKVQLKIPIDINN